VTGIDTPPDQAAEAVRQARRFDTPQSLLPKPDADLARRAKLEDASAIVQAHPKLEDWLAGQHPTTTAMVSDDLDNMGLFTKTANAFRSGLTSTMRGFNANNMVDTAEALSLLERVRRGEFKNDADLSARGGPYASMFVGSQGTPDALARQEKFLRGKYQDQMQTFLDRGADLARIPTSKEMQSFQAAGDMPSLPINVGGMAMSLPVASITEFLKHPIDIGAQILSSSFGSMAPSVPFIVGTGGSGVVARAGMVGATSSATDFASTLADIVGKEGVDISTPEKLQAYIKTPEFEQAVRKAKIHAAVVGTFDAATAGVANVRLANGGVANVVAQGGVQAAGGMAGEAGGQLASEGKVTNWSDVISEGIGELPGAGIDVALATREARVQHRENEQRVQEAQKTAEMLKEFDNLATASKTRARDIETFEGFLQSATEGTPVENVYISAQALAQSGQAEALAQVSPTVAAQLGDAAVTNGDIRIPVAEVFGRFGEEAKSILPDLKVDPNGFSQREAEEYVKDKGPELEAKVNEILAKQAGNEEFNASRDRVIERIKGDLAQVNRFTPGVHDVYAQILGARFATLASQMGVTPEEIANRYMPKVVGEQIDGFEQNTPAFKAWFGKSVMKDEDGKPIVFYHGTYAAEDFSAFDRTKANYDSSKTINAIGSWFADTPENANIWAGAARSLVESGRTPNENSRVVPVYLKIENPLTASRDDFRRLWSAHGGGDERGRNGSPEKFRDWMRSQGYDGIILDAQEIDSTHMDPGRYAIALDPEQIKSAVGNNGEYSPNTGDFLRQSARRGTQEAGTPIPESVDGASNVEASFAFAESQQFPTNRDFKVAIQARVLEAAKAENVQLDKFTAGLEQYLVRMALADGKTALRTNANAVGWYREKVTKALRLVSLIHPEISTDPKAKFAFVWALAVTSNGLKVDKNFELAEEVYETYKATGKMPTDAGIGTAAGPINKSLGLYDKLIEKYGYDALEQFMTTLQKAGDVESFTGQKVSGENKTTMVYGAAALGPKIGNGFFMNLYGHFEQLTMDRWLMRTWGRWTGTLIEDNSAQVKIKRKALKDLIKSLTPADKKQFEAIIKRKLSVSDIDAVGVAIWKASTSPASRIEMAKIGVVDEQGHARLSEILGDPKANQVRVSFGDELRKVGNALTKYIDGQKEMPEGPPERGNIRKVFQQALAEMQKEHPALTMSDFQALLWYPEKRLYDAAKTADEATNAYEDDEAPDYANAAAKLARKKGISDADIAAAVAEVDAELRADVGATGVRSGERGSGDRAGSAGQETGPLKQSAEPLSQPARGLYDPASRTIALLKAADLSTFLHESGHFFLDIQGQLASQPGAPAQIVDDMNALLDWFGIESTPDQSKLERWMSMSLDEQRQHHEALAESFEHYLFEGKAPSVRLQGVFSRIRTWMISLYRAIKDIYRTSDDKSMRLNDEVRGVFDRMLATEDEIADAEASNTMGQLFKTPEEAAKFGVDWRAYHDMGAEATEKAQEELQARNLRDMKWLDNARSRVLKKLQKQAESVRDDTRMAVRSEILVEPVYQAWQFLTAKPSPHDDPPAKAKRDPSVLDVERDSLMVAIGKLGGLNRDAVASQWGYDTEDLKTANAALFRKPFRTKGGLTPDEMAAKLVEAGYLPTHEYGNGVDMTDLDDKLREELGGTPQYSQYANYSLLRGEEEIRQVDVNPETGLWSGRLDRDVVRLMLHDDAAGYDRLLALGMLRKEGGLHPDAVAQGFGFSSGDEMVRELVKAPAPREIIEAMTDKRMLEEHGELTDPKAMQEAANQAVYNEARARMVAAELSAVESSMGAKESAGTDKQGRPRSQRTLPKAARGFAENMIARLKIMDIRPSQYEAQASRAARNADKAMRSGKTNEVAIEKRNQLVNTYAAKAAHLAREEVDKGLAYLGRLAEATGKTVDLEYLDQIHGILERFDLRRATSLKEIAKRKALSEWLKEQEDLGIEPDLPAYVTATAGMTSYKELSLEEFRGLVDSIKQIEHLGRLKTKLLLAKDNRQVAAIVSEIGASIIANSNGKTAQNRTRHNLVDNAVNLFQNYTLSHRKFASLVRELDGFKDGGPMWEHIVRTMNERGNFEATRRATATKEILALLKPVQKLGRMGGKGVYFDKLGISLNREERLVVALNVGNDGNLQRLLDGRHWTAEGLQQVLDTITPEEADFVQGVWDYFESYRPEIGAKERRVMGVEPNWVQPRPVSLGGKELKGGYYPIVFDPRESGRAESDADAEAAKRQMSGARVAATTRRSFVKERAAQVKERPLLLTMDGMFRGLNDVIHDLAWHEWLIDTNRLLRQLDPTIRKTYGAALMRQFKDAVKDIAAGEAGDMDALGKAIQPLRTGAVVAGLGFNLVNTALQVVGLTQSMVRIGPAWVAKGVAAWAGSPVELTKNVLEKSEFMRNRSRTQQRELNEAMAVVRDKGAVRRGMDRLAYAPMQAMQFVVDMPTWWGAYQKALTEAPIGMDDETVEARAVQLADQAVLDAQGGGQVKDLAAVQRGNEFKKLLTAFYGFFSTTYNLAVERTKATDLKNPLEVARLGTDYLLLLVVPAVLSEMVKSALSGGGDDDEDMKKKVASGLISYIMGTMVGVREASSAVQKAAGVQVFNGGYGGPAALRFFSELDKLGQQLGQGDLDRALVRSAINVVGVVLHLPSSQINRTLDGVIAIEEGRTQNPMALVGGAR
jgi:hypothetical protein